MRSAKYVAVLWGAVSATILPTSVRAADRWWVGPASASWNSTAHWSAASGGASGASVPGSVDIARIVHADFVSRNVILDLSTTVGELRIGNAGLGTNEFTQPSGFN